MTAEHKSADRTPTRPDLPAPADGSASALRRAPIRKVDADSIPNDEPAAGHADTPPTAHIVAAVTRAIVEHRLLPGAKLVEQKIADRFGVSRTIVRQAFNRLSELKLIKLEPARGAFVAAPSIREAQEVFAVRRMVEGQMLRELIACVTPADIAMLREHIQAEREAVERIDVPTRTNLLFNFHVRLAQVLGNSVLTDLIDELVSRCSLISLMYQSADNAVASHQEHTDILRAIEARDADAAQSLLDAHLQAVIRQLTERPRVATASRT
jgi:DNA-binding GntR family transcriptional regulator